MVMDILMSVCYELLIHKHELLKDMSQKHLKTVIQRKDQQFAGIENNQEENDDLTTSESALGVQPGAEFDLHDHHFVVLSTNDNMSTVKDLDAGEVNDVATEFAQQLMMECSEWKSQLIQWGC